MLRLIGHYQAGQNPTPELAFRPGPLPKFDSGVSGGSAIPPPPPGAIQAQSSPAPIRVPPLTPENFNRYAALFENSGAQNGILPGEQAKKIFEKAGLPNEILGRIWNLADTEQRGALVVTEFIIAMHLLMSYKGGTLRSLPTILPAGLYEAAARRAPVQSIPGTSSASAPLSSIPRQFNSAITGRAGSPLSRSSFAPPQASQAPSQSNDWAISPMEKSQFDSVYSTLDKSNKGFITGEEAVPFFSNSKLPEEVLAQIWDLADINLLGRLSRDEFAVAMFLIRQQRSKRGTLPTSLPPNLIPPGMRNNVRQSVQPLSPTFDSNAQSVSKSAAEDLFGLDALSASPPAQPQVSTSTGGSASFGDPFSSNKISFPSELPSSPTQGGSPGRPTSFKPFIPSSSFGRTLTYDATGTSNNSASSQQVKNTPSAVDDLLGDNDPEVSKKLTNETTELANLSNQIGTLSKQVLEVQGQRSIVQNELSQANSQKREFELRLSQLRSQYEQEAKDVRGLQERLTASRNATKKLQQEIAMIEGTYQDLQNQHRHIVTAFQADQLENATLKDRIKVLNGEITQIKLQLEKLRSEARQIRGHVAINKKQLATNESERDKLKADIEEIARSNEEQSRAITTSSQAQSPPLTSPTLSTLNANNPFFRRQPSISSDVGNSTFAQSPAPPSQPNRSFDKVFGPSFATTSATGENSIHQTSIKQEHEARHSSPTTTLGKSPSRRSAEGSENNGSSISQQNTSSREASEAGETPTPLERQISSTFMPFPQDHSNSFGSSRQVSSPNSRFGESSTTNGADTPTSHNGATPTGLPGPGQTETIQGLSSTFDRNRTASPATSETRSVTNVKDSMPGAFPGDGNTHIISTPTGGSSLSEQALGNVSSPFLLNKEAPNDFETAFASFGSSGASQVASQPTTDDPTTNNFNKEFPPLQELEVEDESDSGSERGFEDDFTSASPSHSRKESSTHSQFSQSQGVGTTGTGTLFPNLSPTPNSASIASLGPNPPASNSQSSPQKYDKTVSSHDKARPDVEQYSGLLPTRESTAPSQAGDHPFNSPLATGGQALFANPSPSSLAKPSQSAKAKHSEFGEDDLTDAVEGSGDSPDVPLFDVPVRFDPTFDSPSTSKTSQHTAQGSTSFGNDSTTGFGDFTQSPVSTSKPQLAQSGPSTTNHDWEAIFASLGASKNNESTGGPGIPAKDTGGSSTSIGNSAAAQPMRPQAGRALTEAGVHDDPKLKDLIPVGYNRKAALSALEKSGYDLEGVRAPVIARRIGPP